MHDFDLSMSSVMLSLDSLYVKQMSQMPSSCLIRGCCVQYFDSWMSTVVQSWIRRCHTAPRFTDAEWSSDSLMSYSPGFADVMQHLDSQMPSGRLDSLMSYSYSIRGRHAVL